MKKCTKYLLGMAVFAAAMSFFACKQPQPATKSAVPEGMSLVWADEFDYEGAPDESKWDYSLGNINGWGNAEIQKYTKNKENVYVSKGVMTISALRTDPKSNSWTSARVKTQYKASWDHGYIEVCAKLPQGVGTWPAIWMLPNAEKYGGWPRSGEIDIMEMVGFDQDEIHTTIHTLAFNHKNNTQKTKHAKFKNTTTQFHTYAIDWTEDYIKWIIDGEVFYEVENPHQSWQEWPFDIPFYLIMNIAIDGTWGGQHGVDPKLMKADMVVDYVRVYQ